MKKKWILLLMMPLFALPLRAQTTNANANMVWVGGGSVQIGTEKGADDEKPPFETNLAGFWIDANPITIGEFRKFVRFNHYITTAEKKGYAMCYDSTTKEWKKVRGANWMYPLGTEKSAPNTHEPVRQISWYDAQAYSNWIGKRLPSELEWEKVLQNAEKLQLAYTAQSLWQWCDNWYFSYNESNYFTEKLNRPKSLRGGAHNDKFRPSLRYALFPEESFYNVGFRCVKDK